MAIWQYGLLVVPKTSILKKYGEIPEKLIDRKSSWKKIYEKLIHKKIIPKIDIFNPKTNNFWKNVNLEINQIENEINKLVTKESWSEPTFLAWKGNSEIDEDNDCHIVLDKLKKQIIEFQFRTDLRNIKNINTFLIGLIKICKENNLLLIDDERNILEPKFETVMEKIKNSRAFEFLENPEKFLEKINTENKNIR